jgi:hypothetical protein
MPDGRLIDCKTALALSPGLFLVCILLNLQHTGVQMKRLDSEKFRAAFEAIVAEKSQRSKAGAVQPREGPLSRTHMPAADFEAIMEKRRGVR